MTGLAARSLTALAVLFLTVVVAAGLTRTAASADPTARQELLTDPFLQNPQPRSVRVVWFTEWRGDRHVVVFGEQADELDQPQLARLGTLGEDETERLEEGRLQEFRELRVAVARTAELSRTREDASSLVPGRAWSAVTRRPVWRHEALVFGLRSGTRVPYRVISTSEDGSVAASRAFTLAPLPPRNSPLKILLTSDNQSQPMTPANLQKVEETIGTLDAVFFAGDLVNVPDRASDWFDDARGRAFFPSLQGRAQGVLERAGTRTSYRGGELIQNAPLFPAIGNHEVMGRVGRQGSLAGEYNDAWPRQAAEALYEQRRADVNPAGDPEVRERFIENNSFNTVTYEEIFQLPHGSRFGPTFPRPGVPPSSDGDERYYAESIGDVRLVSLFVAQPWRTPSRSLSIGRGKYLDGLAASANPLEWGWGQFVFDSIARGSEQYEWLEREVKSREWRRAKYRVVMFHYPMHTLGDNGDLPFVDPVRSTETDPVTGGRYNRYEYLRGEDQLLRDVEPLVDSAGADLVLYGHSHLWNRFRNAAGTNFLETSNVGNSYGAFDSSTGLSRNVPTGPPWDKNNYTPQGDKGGLKPIMPSIVAPQRAADGSPLPFVASNDLTVFSILDTGTGTVDSYVYDTRRPGSQVTKFDSFPVGDATLRTAADAGRRP